MTLELEDLQIDCVIGDLPEERAREGRVEVSASLDVGDAAGASDALSDTADYAALAAKMRDALVRGRFRLLERAASAAADACLEDPRVRSAKVRVAKRGAVPGLGAAAATCRKARAAMPEYELAGIETIARGVCVRDGRLLLCRAKGAKTSYLPGGHIEFGETGREALVREIKEETGLAATTGEFLGAVENSFVQHGKPHAEINLVYRFEFDGDGADGVSSREDWISFEWRGLGELGEAGLLPEAFRRLGDDPNAKFGV